MAMGTTLAISHLSCGYVGLSDGWTDLQNFTMDWEFDKASEGSVALTAQLDWREDKEFTVGLAFGNSEHRAVANLLQSLGTPFDEHLAQLTLIPACCSVGRGPRWLLLAVFLRQQESRGSATTDG